MAQKRSLTGLPEARAAIEKPQSLEQQFGGTHYKGLAIEPAEYCQKNNLKFCEASAIKYLSRHQLKGGVDDVLKAIHFAQMVLEMEYGVKSVFVRHVNGEGSDGIQG